MAKPRKRPVNLSIDESLVNQARALNINLSQALEKAVVTELRKAEREKWARDNRTAVDAYNQRVDEAGAYGDGVRGF